MSKAQKSETACPHKCAQDGMCLEKKSQAYNCVETRQRNDRQAMVCVYQTLRTQCARLQCMYTPTAGAHLGSLCMRALPHFGLGILAIPCDPGHPGHPISSYSPHIFSTMCCVTAHSPLKNAELNVSKGGGGPQGAPECRKRRSLSAGKWERRVGDRGAGPLPFDNNFTKERPTRRAYRDHV